MTNIYYSRNDMLFKVIATVIIIIIKLCDGQSIVNLFDFVAPILGILSSGTNNVCYDDLGCFSNDGPYQSSSLRPISCVPQSPQLIGTQFLFYSRDNPNDPQIIDALNTKSYKNIDFDPKLNTKIVIHGYKAGILEYGFQHNSFEVVKDGIIFNEESNVILVQWMGGANGLYFQSVANCRVVGAQIALLINHLIKKRNAKPELFHLIGFSLGAHISGYTGKLVANLGRITALDTAKPYFDGVSHSIRLSSEDALFIDALHTDNDIGSMNATGNIDIYFNGGEQQPGCSHQIFDTVINEGILYGLFETLSCDHKRALDYYADYLLTSKADCKPIAYRCESWEKFMSGFCWSCGQNGEDCIIVGLNNTFNNNGISYRNPDNKFYIITNDRQPYCVYQYLVQMTAHSTKSKIDANVNIRLYSYNNTFNDKSG
ncbi:pancreatic lipase-related protein 2-like [Oppia nitens]|uniref:pancreatic lipase-related protein 2-like n=1 Tax=Oppia nitens TaxID=1686743 RepID=UPI0023D9F73C|nr:pancreatic lipase-related protein 2-like [Oppia nitens]